MLNELYQVYSSMQAHQIEMPEVWHGKMMGAPKHDAFVIIYLDELGEVKKTRFGIGTHAKWDDSKNMRAFELASTGLKSGARFPVILPQYKTKVQVPSNIKQQCKDKVLSKSKCETITGLARIDAFNDVLKQKLNVLVNELLPDLHKKIDSYLDEEELSKVISVAIASLEKMDIPLLIEKLLIDNIELEEQIKKNKSILVVFELHDCKFSDYPMSHSKTIKKLNKLLVEFENQDQQEQSPSLSTDIFGADMRNSGYGFKAIKIKNFSDVYPRSLNHAVPGFTRWGQQSNALCPVGQDSKNNLVGALEWITSPGFEEKTWRSMQRITGKKELLIAFSGLPENKGGQEDFNLLDAMAPQTTTVLEGDYAEVASFLVKVFDGVSPEIKLKNMMFFSIRNTSNNTAGVHNYGTYSVSFLIKSAKLWEQAAKNLPYFYLHQAKKQIPLRSPYPAEIIPLVNRSNKDESASKEPRLFELEDAFYLFTGSENQQRQIAERLIYLLIDRPFRKIIQQVSYYRAWYPKNDWNRQKLSKENVKFMLRLPVLLAMGLYKINIHKEVYMVSAPFLIGQYLALLDEIHLHYYWKHNNKKTPNTLIGSRTISTALDNPIQAISTSGQRSIIYIEWIKTKAKADAVGGGWSSLRFRIEENSRKLSQVDLPDNLNEVEKAQLILGFIAGSESEKAND